MSTTTYHKQKSRKSSSDSSDSQRQINVKIPAPLFKRLAIARAERKGITIQSITIAALEAYLRPSRNGSAAHAG